MDEMFICVCLKLLGWFYLVEQKLTYDTNRYYQSKLSNLRSADILYRTSCLVWGLRL